MTSTTADQWKCSHCHQVNAGLATDCGRCEQKREGRAPPSTPNRPCPTCGDELSLKEMIDSDFRIYASWLYCACGYDQRASSAGERLNNDGGEK